jgi:hypothetical protein
VARIDSRPRIAGGCARLRPGDRCGDRRQVGVRRGGPGRGEDSPRPGARGEDWWRAVRAASAGPTCSPQSRHARTKTATPRSTGVWVDSTRSPIRPRRTRQRSQRAEDGRPCAGATPEYEARDRRRIFNVLAAALSNAYRLHGVGDLSVWRRVKAVKLAKATRARLATEQEIKDLLAKCSPTCGTRSRGGAHRHAVRQFAASRFGTSTQRRGARRGYKTAAERFCFRALRRSSPSRSRQAPRARIFTTAEGGRGKSMQHRRMRGTTPSGRSPSTACGTAPRASSPLAYRPRWSRRMPAPPRRCSGALPQVDHGRVARSSTGRR